MARCGPQNSATDELMTVDVPNLDLFDFKDIDGTQDIGNQLLDLAVAYDDEEQLAMKTFPEPTPDDDEDGDDKDGDDEDGNDEDGDEDDSATKKKKKKKTRTSTQRTQTLIPLTSKTVKRLESTFYALVLVCFTELVEDPRKRLYNVVEAFLLAVNVKQDRVVCPVVTMAPELSKLQFGILYAIVKDAIQSGTSDVTKRLDAWSRWYDPTQTSPFASVRYLQTLAYNEGRNKIGIPHILWYEGEFETRFTFDNKETCTLKIIEGVQKMYKDAVADMDTLVHGAPLHENDALNAALTSVKDNHTCMDYGYGFAPQESNLTHMANLMGTLFCHAPFTDAMCGEDGGWLDDGI
ncbi:hypothetical protein C8R45DRAFT_946103 [Mycena sanguinolenta]|nr:hypothetical protein C8R45DRAFT_946103 [Mycena sanguinolenta]